MVFPPLYSCTPAANYKLNKACSFYYIIHVPHTDGATFTREHYVYEVAIMIASVLYVIAECLTRVSAVNLFTKQELPLIISAKCEFEGYLDCKFGKLMECALKPYSIKFHLYLRIN